MDSINNEEEKLSMTEAELKDRLKKERKKGTFKGFIISFIVMLLLLILFGVAKLVTMAVDGSLFTAYYGLTGKTTLTNEDIKKFNKIYKIIDASFLFDYDKEAVIDGMYHGMMEALDDPYSVYYSKEEYKQMEEDSSGTFEGIGAYLSQDPDTMLVTVVRPIKDSPAEKAGILKDDILVEVDGEDITGQDLNLVVSKIRGPKGSEVNVGVIRGESKEIIRFDLKRDKINSISVEEEMLDDKIGYIRITEFEEATDKQFIEAYDKLTADGMKSLIIDLRSNGGGYVDTSVKIADRLVKEGTIVTAKNRNGKSFGTYVDKGDDNYLRVPCVVLADMYTASSSEILIGALRDHGLITLIGTKTFGKGIIQDVLPLGDGSGIKFTVARYCTPNGTDIHEVGFEPDYEVPFDGEKYKKEKIDNQLEAAKNYLKTGKIE